MLEASLRKTGLGPLPKPLAGMIFHWDKFSGQWSLEVMLNSCEVTLTA